MHKAQKCPNCGVITRHKYCTCGGIPQTIRRHNLHAKLSIDVTLTLRFDHDHHPFILVQKPSGQDRVRLTVLDLIHV